MSIWKCSKWAKKFKILLTNAQYGFILQKKMLKTSRKEKGMYPNIEAERVRNRMSKEQLAKELGISLKTYYNWLNGLTAIPSTALIKMSKIFRVEMEYLLTEVPPGKDEKGA